MRIRHELRRVLAQYETHQHKEHGVLGNGAGVVAVPDKPGMVYVRVGGGIRTAYNNRVAAVDGLPVIVGYDHIQPNVYQVLDVAIYDAPPPYNARMPQHAHTHEYLADNGGYDMVYVSLRAWLPLLVRPVGGMVVEVYQAVHYTGGSYRASGGTIDLTAYVPTSGARYVLIQVQPSGGLSVKPGRVVTSMYEIQLADIPAPDGGCAPLAAVALYAGQQAISESRELNDIIDLRWPYVPAAPVYAPVSAMGDGQILTDNDDQVITDGAGDIVTDGDWRTVTDNTGNILIGGLS